MAMFLCLEKTTLLEQYDAVAFETSTVNNVVKGRLMYMSDIIYGGNGVVHPAVVKNKHPPKTGTDENGFRKWMNIDQIRVAVWRGVLTIPLEVLRENRATCLFLQENLNREMEIDEFTADMMNLTFEPYSTDPKVFLNTVIADSDRCLYRSFGQSQ